MNVTAIVTKPQEVEVTITATFTVAEWSRIREALCAANYFYPMSQLAYAIRDATQKIEQTVTAEVAKEGVRNG